MSEIEAGTKDRLEVLEKTVRNLETQLKRADQTITALQDKIKSVEGSALKSGDTLSFKCQNEHLTWMTQGGEVKSRGTDYIPQFQGWTVTRR